MLMVSIGKKFVAESLGTFLLVFFGAGAVVITRMIVFGAATPNPFSIGISMADWLGINIVFGLAIAVGIYAFARVSGAHFNPAITVALWAVRKFPSKDVVPYILAQLVGATIASLLFALCIGSPAVALKLGATAPFYGVGYGQAIIVEAVGTFLLMLAVMAVAVDKRATPGFAGLIIGLSVTASLTLISNITGGSINPARTFGPYLGNTLLGGANLWIYFPIYVIGPIAGALVAAFIYTYVNSGTE
ncbi:MAG: MIP/aquaporin family protein [Methanobacterium sp.]|jgi:glycerol uptake facilitator protein